MLNDQSWFNKIILIGQRIIHQLDETVIKRIAAGEVIHGPINVFKELLENALDSGADRISIIFKGGGTTLIEVSDNGCGISDEDMELVCKRHTTSKITSYKDIAELQTFGFRGEALFSISCISNLSIKTNQKDTTLGTLGNYYNGDLIGELQSCTCTKGTTITAQNIFLGNQQRLNSLPNFRLRNRKVIFLMLKYCVAMPNVAFSLFVDDKDKIRSSGMATHEDVLRSLFSYQDTTRLDFEITKTASAAIFLGSPKKKMMKINGVFVNGRLVHNDTIKRGITKLYDQYTKPGVIPFFIVLLKISSQNLDVNVHPAKKTVLIAREKFIANVILSKVEQHLKVLYSKREEKTKIVNFTNSEEVHDEIPPLRKNSYVKTKLEIESEEKQKDVEAHFLDEFDENDATKEMLVERRKRLFKEIKFKPKKIEKKHDFLTLERFLMISKDKATKPKKELTNDESHDKKFIEALKGDIKLVECKQLSNFIVAMKLVGFIGLKYILVDVSEALYIIDLHQITKEFFRQISLEFVGNFGVFVFDRKIDIKTIYEEMKNYNDSIIDIDYKIIEKYRNYLLVNFKIEIDEEFSLISLPIVVPGYLPLLSHIPTFLVGLYNSMTLKDIDSIFVGIIDCLSDLFAINESDVSDSQYIKRQIEENIIPEMRRAAFRPPKKLYDDGYIKQITNTRHIERLFAHF
ncbi:DNA mismatch repair protein, putative [Trichomonas vaginalis G3]|uniref:DNA mismatch repair protein, putative n=2 Tax=Trichomonas vaginalis TaxID=5722 RepID=A2E9G5_TRIV3|nr:DNA mismatch repair protein MLH1C [Trichomonas vaginalis G3]AEW27281.1 MLH1C [Trichomonas vaginalis]EAY10729.1 DNA mismatch repair protein, putative [Trichomonas vaginalis G3]KAI5538622.1 DNA mismatch repair protein MLH1C [Trichomonas vaginalis G3]|eukprot:XP_001322952.1 DNA mismatch repair protein [Trichomonas vaginalis G3]